MERSRRRGGWRMQRDNAQDEAREEVSQTVKGHLLDWGDGIESSVRLKRHCANAVADGLRHPALVSLSTLGGANEQHTHQAMMEFVLRLGIGDLITDLPGPDVTQVVLPSSLIKVLHQHYNHEFRRRVGGDETLLSRFWEEFFRSPDRRAWSQQSRFLTVADADWSRVVPLTCHEGAGLCIRHRFVVSCAGVA